MPYREAAWEQVDRGERPVGDELAEGFFHLARIEERAGPRDEHSRFTARVSCLDPLDPPLEGLRQRLALEPPRWRGARFAIALTHDVDIPWRWTRNGVRGSAARLKSNLRAGRLGETAREARGLLTMPVYKLRRTDPNWSFERILAAERRFGASSTFFLMAGHAHPADGPSSEAYERLRPRLVETIRGGDGEVGLHGSYSAAEEMERLHGEKETLERLAGPVAGQRFHYLRLDPHRNLGRLAELGFRYDSTLGFPDAVGFRGGLAQPFRPWDVEADAPSPLVEVPLAAMDVTLAEERYLGLAAAEAERRLTGLLDWAAEHGGGFAVLWHSERFDPATTRGWDRLYSRFIQGVQARGGVCLTAGELAEEADEWLP